MRGSNRPERASMGWRLLLSLLTRLPQATVSRAMGRLADLEIPRLLRTPLLGLFSLIIGIDRDEVELPLSEYRSLNAYFVRRLRPGVRHWPEARDLLVSPVDGTCGQRGVIEAGRIVQAKGHWYSASTLLDDEVEASRFDGGEFLTIYLSPRDYHRIHTPISGVIASARHIPGALLPVNPPAVLEIPDLFPRNERLICYLDSEVGRVAIVAVGAINVGRISTAFDPDWSGAPWLTESGPTGGGKGVSRWVTNRRGVEGVTHHYEPPIGVEPGEEIMAFHLGSTVVLLFEPGQTALDPDLTVGSKLRVGELIGSRP